MQTSGDEVSTFLRPQVDNEFYTSKARPESHRVQKRETLTTVVTLDTVPMTSRKQESHTVIYVLTLRLTRYMNGVMPIRSCGERFLNVVVEF